MSVDGAHTTTGAWAIEAVDAPKSFSRNTPRFLAVDAGNHPHFVYGGNHLYYAYHDGDSWHYETIDASFDVGGCPSLTLDTSGHAHISYQDNDNKDLKYATNASGSWVTTTVDSYGWVGFTSSIAIDASGHVHISYFDEIELGNQKEILKYATNVSGSWVPVTVDSVYALFRSSIAVDPSGHAHISYGDGNFGLRYATNASGSWITVTVGSEEDVGAPNSLALDASDKAHISHEDVYYYDLKYTTNVSGRWVTTTVDSKGDAGKYSSIGVDASGRVHISDPNFTVGDLKYATSIHVPAATTKPATNITKTSARLNATVNAKQRQTLAWFEWGVRSGGPYTYVSPRKTFSGEIDLKHHYKARELIKGRTYYYRVVAENEDGLSYGEEMSFETKR